MKEKFFDALSRLVAEAIGAGSMCWSETPKGEFASNEARDLADKFTNSIVDQFKGSFAWALVMAQEGEKIQRRNWNGPGQYVYFVPANSYPAVTAIAKEQFGEMVPYAGYMAIKPVNNVIVPWLPSQTDLTANDWQIVGSSQERAPVVDRKDLVSFGTYLLSERRRERMAQHPDLLDKNLAERLAMVHHADVENWLEDQQATVVTGPVAGGLTNPPHEPK